MGADQGTLIINHIPDAECKTKVAAFLARHSKNCSEHQIVSMLHKMPVVLGRNVCSKIGAKFVKELRSLGASVSFVPHEPATTKVKGQSQIRGEESPQKGLDKDDQESLDAEKRAVKEQLYEEKLIASASLKGFEGSDGPFLESPDIDWQEDKGVRPYRNRNRKGRSCCLADKIAEVNKELWIIFSMVAVAGLMNYLVASQYMILGFYSFPTIMSAYFYGRRHAVMTAVLTIILVGIMMHFNSAIFGDGQKMTVVSGKWYHMMAWGSVLVCTAYAMGTLYERHMRKVRELRRTYQGLIVILRHFISKDQYTENHCYRVSLYAAKIASYLGLDDEEIEDIRSAGLLHDIGKLKISRELLYKAAKLSEDEYKEIKNHVKNSAEILEPLKGPLGRIIPIILAHHDRFDGKGYRPNKGEEIPLGARILAVADVYDALTSDRPYRKAMAPTEAKEIILKGAGRDFDPQVVKAFMAAFERGEMDVPNLIV